MVSVIKKNLSRLVVSIQDILDGCLTSSAGEVQFVPIGVMLQVGALIAESFRITLVQILLQKKGIKLNPIATLYYIAPCCFAFLFPVFLWVEGGEMMRNGSKLIGLTPLLLCNAALAFGEHRTSACNHNLVYYMCKY